ncbi:hypothetical protein [Polyangium aurulentum]|uniref:hypothetical protein n=1 Tax=Polyangium aurulentum TaxID=2567896 RepID=UPI0010AE7A80|nr:hypothetical protein [Polyangium aurulentum]UQA61175.1 hypothetical protein E8A73_012130 [Polyangium aurulentum]
MARRSQARAQTDPDAWKPPPHGNAEVHRLIMEEWKRMTPAEALESLVQAGICTPDGELTAPYRDEPEPRDARGKRNMTPPPASTKRVKARRGSRA